MYMIKIIDKSKCCGCSACANICPVQCIKMDFDSKGFYYPTIDENACIKCNKCDKVCPFQILPKDKPDHSSKCYSAYSKDTENLHTASSGGIFWELANLTLSQNGVVYGAVSNDGFHVQHMRGETTSDCLPMRKSKYQQSIMDNNYQFAKKDLENGRYVLFSGTPCQIAGLYGYLGKDYEKLVTVDLVCHGIPSKKILELFKEKTEIEKGSQLISWIWRDKSYGWEKKFSKLMFLDSEKDFLIPSSQNPYMKGFAQCLYLRPSCYTCPFARLPRVSDITLGDFFGYDRSLDNRDKGLSMVVATTRKGQNAVQAILKSLEYDEVSEQYCNSRSHQLGHPPRDNKNRKFVYDNMESMSFEQIEQYFTNKKLKPFLINIRSKIFRFLFFMRRKHR